MMSLLWLSLKITQKTITLRLNWKGKTEMYLPKTAYLSELKGRGALYQIH